MNVKLHTPKSLKAGSGMASLKQFLLSLLATTVSIALTFGTAAIIDNYKKQREKREMVKMIIYDFEKTIQEVESLDTLLTAAKDRQLLLAAHPENLDSLRYPMVFALSQGSTMTFSEATERIFSSSIETFITIGNANFISMVSEFYNSRKYYQSKIIDRLAEDAKQELDTLTAKDFLNINFVNYSYTTKLCLKDLRTKRIQCMQLMDISEEDMKEFGESAISGKDSDADIDLEMMEQWERDENTIMEAKDK